MLPLKKRAGGRKIDRLQSTPNRKPELQVFRPSVASHVIVHMKLRMMASCTVLVCTVGAINVEKSKKPREYGRPTYIVNLQLLIHCPVQAEWYYRLFIQQSEA
ncbi:hypothetical protein P168DRAFT_59687 [Aspergillus campestris IBT 28561]|uniref:Uncharacterized protein n=1 Tax=Aspergillus campestris (strain IBT 28561) TaxID=1392248 RepID=A0A2I1CU66_ASPC2|nr:uncharacterized protein P168DRAFT_59687 [Aspergillus campestris IBT 28561]PKY01173.1 hypothetical protein P168DRAFT_59687 [Aspergillus campestris IBT 28561]